MILAINKIDDKTVNYSEDRYNEIKKEVMNYLKKIGYDVSKIPCIPISGWMGDNLFDMS
jgi:elongation factor 1-alpha